MHTNVSDVFLFSLFFSSSGLAEALGILICCCGCALADKGDVEQQGGTFVFTAGGACKFKHLQQNPDDYADVSKVLAAVGLTGGT